MTGLLKSDFRRILKDKLLIVVGILAVVFAITLPLLYAVIFSTADVLATEMLGNMFTAKTLFFSSFSMGNNLGLVVPVLLAIILCKDFSFGTVRNKIIAGKSRKAIYMSLFMDYEGDTVSDHYNLLQIPYEATNTLNCMQEYRAWLQEKYPFG